MTLYYFVFRDDVLVACFSMRLYCLERDFHDDSMRLAGVFSMKLYCYLTLWTPAARLFQAGLVLPRQRIRTD